MTTVLRVAFTMAVALLGTRVFLKHKVPAGAFVGAVVFVGAVQIATGIEYFPPAVKTFCSALAGSYLGTKVRRSDLAALRKAPLAAAVMVVTLLCYNFFSAFVIARMTSIDFGSAMLGMAPGGSTEFSLVAADMGYNIATVTIIQMLRMALIVPTVPMTTKLLLKYLQKRGIYRQEQGQRQNTVKREKHVGGFLAALVIGIGAGLLGKWSGIPAGTISFSMAAVAVVNVITDKLYFPLPARYFANSCNGALIGVKLTLGDILLVGEALPVVVALDAGWLILAALNGLIIYRLSEFSLATALFSGVPGGISDMGLIAEDMGGNPTQVTVMQLCRLVCVLTLCPAVLHWME